MMKRALRNGNKRGDIKVKKEVKSRKHILCEKAPLVAMILAAALALIVLSIPGLIGLSEVAGNLASSVLAVLFMIAYTKWFAPEFKGVFKTSRLATGLAFVWLAFAFKFFGAYFVTLADSGFYFKPTVAALAMAIAAGFYEETIFRGVTVPIGMRYFKSEKRVGILVLISALVFGLMHIGNIANGASIQMGIAQGIATTFAGIFFIAVYLRTGNLLIPIFMHGIFDYMCFTVDPTLENGIMANDIAASALVFAVLVDVIAGIWGLYLLRPAKRAEIHAIWNDKWSVDKGESSSYV